MYTISHNFEEWTPTTIPYVLVTALGYYGLCQYQHAIDSLNRFYQWYIKEKPDGYIPTHSTTTPMFAQQTIAIMIEYVNRFDQRLISADQTHNKRQALIILHHFWDQLTELERNENEQQSTWNAKLIALSKKWIGGT
jgi:hypothetical protein